MPAPTATALRCAHGRLTLDAAGRPQRAVRLRDRHDLDDRIASAVLLINGASPCNVYWQVGSSATLGTRTAFQGNLMASPISRSTPPPPSGPPARPHGAVTLDTNTHQPPELRHRRNRRRPAAPAALAPAARVAPAAPAARRDPAPALRPAPRRPTSPRRPAVRQPRPTTARHGSAVRRPRPRPAAGRPGPAPTGFQATVRGHLIKRVVFSLDGKRIGTRTKSAFRVYVRAAKAGSRVI